MVLENSIKSIVSSNQFIKLNTNNLYELLQARVDEVQTQASALYWLKKLKGLHEATNSIVRRINSLETSLNSKLLHNEIDIGLKNYLILLEAIGTKDNKLVDSLLISVCENGIDKFIVQGTNNKIILNIATLKNSIYLTENKIVTFAHNSTSPICTLRFEKFSTLIGQNAMHFMQGDELVISAGIGSYTTIAAPNFIIEKHPIAKLDENGVATYRKKIAEGIGKYKIPVIVEYINPNGEKKVIERVVEYEVH